VAVVANVAINVDSRGAPAKLKQVADRSKQVEKAVQGMNGDLRRSQREFKGAGNAANQAASGFGKLGKAIAGVATVAAAFQALKFTVVKTAELETQTRSLKVLTGSLETAQKIVQQLQDIGAVTPFTSTELIDTAKRLRAFGVETEKLVDTTRRLGDVAGATGADLGGIATAFGQIQAKGRLQGEELLQLQERGIDLQSELQRMYGLTGEEFRKALEKGRFSAEAVDVALQNLTNTGGKYANGAIAQSDTLAGKFSTLQDGITRTAQVIGQVLSPALQTILDQAIGVVNSINNALSAGRRIQQFGIDAQQRNQLFQQAGEEAEEIARLRGGGRIDPAVFTQLRDERFRDLIERYGYETGQIQVETQAPTLGAPKVPELLGGGGGGARGGARGGRSGPSPEDILARQTEVGAQLLQQKEREFALAVEQDPLV
jgi:tape measure domain-containing protein